MIARERATVGIVTLVVMGAAALGFYFVLQLGVGIRHAALSRHLRFSRAESTHAIE